VLKIWAELNSRYITNHLINSIQENIIKIIILVLFLWSIFINSIFVFNSSYLLFSFVKYQNPYLISSWTLQSLKGLSLCSSITMATFLAETPRLATYFVLKIYAFAALNCVFPPFPQFLVPEEKASKNPRTFPKLLWNMSGILCGSGPWFSHSAFSA